MAFSCGSTNYRRAMNTIKENLKQRDLFYKKCEKEHPGFWGLPFPERMRIQEEMKKDESEKKQEDKKCILEKS